VSCKKDSNAPPSQNPEVIPLTGDTILYLIKKNNIKNKELTYNSNKTINSIICYNDTGAFSYGAAYNYNLPGKVLYIYNTYANSAYNSYDSCCYNSYDLLTKIYTYSTSAFIYMQNLQYNSDGKLVRLFLLYGGTVNGLNFIYDSNFNVV